MVFRRFSLPGEVRFQNTIQKHDANSCSNCLLDRIGRFTTAPSHFTDIRVQNGAYSVRAYSSLHSGNSRSLRKWASMFRMHENGPLHCGCDMPWVSPILMQAELRSDQSEVR